MSDRLTEPENEGLVTCPHCRGSGRYSYGTKPDESFGCMFCNMTGKLTESERLDYIDKKENVFGVKTK